MDAHPTLRLFVMGEPVATKGAGGSPVVVLAEYAGGRAVERVTLDSAWLAKQQRNVEDLRSFLEDGDPEISLTRLRKIGQHLYAPFVTGGVQMLFASTRGRKELLPCEIYVESGAIAEWPWEFLYDPTSKQFLCEAFHPVSRGVFTQTLPEFAPPKGRRLAILVVLGTMRGDESADAQEQKKAIENVFRSYLGAREVDLDLLQGVDAQALARALAAKEYAIVHYFGHGVFDPRRGEGALLLSHGRGESKLYATDFAAMLVARGIQLVFLNACETGRVDPRFAPTQSALASALVDKGIPAVIATQFPMPENSSHAFASFVYQSLYGGKSLTNAVREGRVAIRCGPDAESMDWGIPVLYTADPHLRLFAEPKRARPWAGTLDAVLGRAPAVAAALAAARRAAGKPRALPIAAGRPKARVLGRGPTRRPGAAAAPSPGRPGAARAASPRRTEGPVHVAICDIDANAAFLPEIVERANAAQSYFSFDVAFLPVRAGAIVREDGARRRDGGSRTLVLSRIEEQLARLPASFGAEQVCCLTRHLVGSGRFRDLFAASSRANPNVQVVSTFGMRDYAAEAGVSYSGAVFANCLAMVLSREIDLDEFHGETAGCPFDFCNDRHDIVAWLKKGRFDHEPCRDRVRAHDPELLAAADALVACALAGKGPEKGASRHSARETGSDRPL